MRISDWSSDVCSSDLHNRWHRRHALRPRAGDTKARTASIISAHRLRGAARSGRGCVRRSEEHTSELQSLMRISYAVFCLKKKPQTHNMTIATTLPQTTYLQTSTNPNTISVHKS